MFHSAGATTTMTTSPRTAVQPIGEFLAPRQKFLLMNSLMLCMFISALDQSIVATAMPRILADLGGFPLLSWVFTVYLLSSTVVVPLAGKLSDMFGRKWFIIGGVALFIAASALCGAAPSMPFLIAARAVQGIGGGLIFACVFSTLGDLFTPLERAKYMGYFIGAFTIASLVGPTLGGFLTDGPGWRWCFYINLPVGAAGIYFIWRNLPNVRPGGRRLADVDALGSALLTGAAVTLILALVWATEHFGWGAPETIGLFGVSLLLWVLFILQEKRHPEAILPLFLFKNRAFVQANLLVVFAGAGMFGAIQYLPTFIQTALGASATASGLVSTPQSVGVLISSVIGGQFVARTGSFKYVVMFGSVLTLIAAWLLHRLGVGDPTWHIAVFMIISGLGGGMIMPIMSVVVQAAVAQEFMGVATSTRQFFMQIAQVMGIAIFGLIFTTTYVSSFQSRSPAARVVVPPAIYAEFKDPTLALDPRRFEPVKATIGALPDGQAVLAETVAAQKQGVADAIDRIFLGSVIAALCVVVLAATFKPFKLRGTFSTLDTTGEAPVMAPEPEPEREPVAEAEPATGAAAGGGGGGV